MTNIEGLIVRYTEEEQPSVTEVKEEHRDLKRKFQSPYAIVYGIDIMKTVLLILSNNNFLLKYF